MQFAHTVIDYAMINSISLFDKTVFFTVNTSRYVTLGYFPLYIQCTHLQDLN